MKWLIWCLSVAVFVAGISADGYKGNSTQRDDDERSFIVGDTDFLMDGEKFQYVAGSFHYFRALRATWKEKLEMMKATGLTVIDTYVEWATHNPKPDVYDWEGLADLVYFLDLTKELELYVIFRPGPYICAERDNGGLPYWLFTKYPEIKVRTYDEDYLAEVRTWYAKLFEKVTPYLYGQGGNIIMVQVENEYGVFEACDHKYMEWVRDETKKYVNDDAVLFTVDIPNERFGCGVVEGVFATTDFGAERAAEMDDLFGIMRKYQPTGPLVNSEFYPGWLTHWQEENQRRDGDMVASALKQQLERGASVNFYMFFGGTNFGFTAGANDWGQGLYMADITSYDYDAVMDEAGDPTSKLIKVRNVIMEHFPSLKVPMVPAAKVKKAYPTVTMKPISNIFSTTAQKYLVKNKRESTFPLTFETMDQFSGFLLYETVLPEFQLDPTVLTINGLADRALIYIDDNFVGTLSRENAIKSLPINSGMGKNMKILVENQGRINFNKLDDYKGILGNVTVQLFEPKAVQVLNDWTISGYPLEDIKEFTAAAVEENTSIDMHSRGILTKGPVFFYGTLDIAEDESILDTYLNPTGWGKGVLYVNGFNVGRYWPLVGPQITMYIPAGLLKAGKNEFVILELQKANVPSTITFQTTAILDGQIKDDQAQVNAGRCDKK